MKGHPSRCGRFFKSVIEVNQGVAITVSIVQISFIMTQFVLLYFNAIEKLYFYVPFMIVVSSLTIG